MAVANRVPTAHCGLRLETLTLLVVCCCKDQDQIILFATWLRHLVHLCCFVVTDVLMDVGDNSPGDALRAVEGRTRTRAGWVVRLSE